MRLWILSVLIALDRVANAAVGGSCDETLSSRAHRMREKHQRVWGWTADAIDAGAACWPFRQRDHCALAHRYERERLNPAITVDTAGRVLAETIRKG